MDEADFSQHQQQRELEAALSIRKRRSYLKPKGSCYNCHDEVQDKQLFCGRECAEGYERKRR